MNPGQLHLKIMKALDNLGPEPDPEMSKYFERQRSLCLSEEELVYIKAALEMKILKDANG